MGSYLLLDHPAQPENWTQLEAAPRREYLRMNSWQRDLPGPTLAFKKKCLQNRVATA